MSAGFNLDREPASPLSERLRRLAREAERCAVASPDAIRDAAEVMLRGEPLP